MVRNGNGDGRQEEECHDNVREVTEPIRVSITQEQAPDNQAEQETQARGHHEGALAPGAPLSGQDLASHGVEQRLCAKGNSGDAVAADDHIKGGSLGDDDGSNSSNETTDDGEPFSAPVVRRLGEDWAEDDREDSDDGREPGRGSGVVELGGDGVRLLVGQVRG